MNYIAIFKERQIGNIESITWCDSKENHPRGIISKMILKRAGCTGILLNNKLSNNSQIMPIQANSKLAHIQNLWFEKIGNIYNTVDYIIGINIIFTSEGVKYVKM